MSTDNLLQELARIARRGSSRVALADDPRWHRLTAGELSREAEAELRAWAATSEDARIAYEAFRPLSSEFHVLIVQSLRLRLLGMPSETESRAHSRVLLEKILDRLVEELSPTGWHLFDLLFLQELSSQEVMERENMTRSSVDQWRSRLRKLIRELEMEQSALGSDNRRGR